MKYLILILLLLSAMTLTGINLEMQAGQVVIEGSFLVSVDRFNAGDDDRLSVLSAQDCHNSNVSGYEIPVYSQLVALPESGNFRLQDGSFDYEEQQLEHRLKPIQLGEEFEPAEDRWLPSEVIAISDPQIMRGSRFARISCAALQYNPALNRIRVLKNVELKFTLDPSVTKNTGKSSLRKNDFSGLNRKIIGNEDSSGRGNYLFIAPQNCSQLLQPLLRWKEKLGYKTSLATLEEIGSTPADIKNYLQYAYDNWAIPPEFVVLVGDVDGNFALPSNFIQGYLYPWCVTDHPYTLLEGDDYFPDVLIGRLSVRDEMQLGTIVSKIINYERNPYVATDWMKSALMVGYVGYDNGFSQREVLIGIRDKLLGFEFAKVDTFLAPGQFGQSLLQNEINSGHSFICYRGAGHSTYWSGGVSGQMLTSNNVLNLNNGYMLPFVTSMTCGGGDFAAAEAPTCFGETWLSAGTPSLPKGAIGFIGPSERDTKSWFNNANAMGIYQGLTQEDIYTGGGLLLRGKMELFINFPFGHGMGNALDSDQFYFYVYNLLGDPGLRIWTDQPRQVELEAGDFFVGSNFLPAQVITNDDKEGFMIALTSADSLVAAALTDESGCVNLPASVPEGLYQLTASKYGYLPRTIDLHVQTADMLVVQSYQFSAPAASGETLQVEICLQNPTDLDAENISIELIPQAPAISIQNPSVQLSLLSSHQEALLIFHFSVSELWQDEKSVDLLVVINSSFGENIALIPVRIVSPDLAVAGYDVQNSSGCLLQNENNDFLLQLYNAGGIASSDLQATLICLNEVAEVQTANSSFSAIAVSDSGVSLSPFTVYLGNNVISGETAKFALELTRAGQLLQVVGFEIPAGIISQTSPTFSDYGYFAVESKDSGNFTAPSYDWQEIDPQMGGAGILVTPGHQNPDGYIRTLSLPFQFRYYGVYYEEISICSEGYLTMGRNDQIFFRNRTIPSGTGSAAMIAPFWDSLDGGNIYVYHDLDLHQFIIQWSEWSSVYDPSKKNTFQVILRNPQYHGSVGLDSEIIFQYKEIHNIDAGFHFATIGIENEAQTDGLLLTFANLNAPTFHPVEAETAVLFTMKTAPNIPYLTIEPAQIEISVTQDSLVQSSFFIRNNSDQNSELAFSLSFSHFGRRGLRSFHPNRSLENDLILQLTGYYVPLQAYDMPFYLLHISPDGEPVIGVTLQFPTGCTINSAQDIQTLSWNGETGNGAEVSWGFSGSAISPVSPVIFLINLYIDPEMPSPLLIDWYIEGDGSGDEPHFAGGTISIPATADDIFSIIYPNGGEKILPGIQDTIRWDHFGSAGEVKLQLSRDGGVNWELITEQAANDKNYPHIFTGPLADNCLIKISTLDNHFPDLSDNPFQITSLNIIYPTQTTVMSYSAPDSIVWLDTAGLESVDIMLTTDNGFSWAEIASSVPNSGVYHFEVPGPPSPYCQIKLSNDDFSVQNISPVFSIADIPVAWLGASQMQGVIPAGEMIEIELTIDPGGMPVGSYQVFIRLESEIGQVIFLPVYLEVSDTIEPAAAVTLYQNVPNPFNPFTRIDYDLPADCNVRLSIFNLRGQYITTLTDELKTAGPHFEYWDGTNKHNKKVSSGIYYYLLKAGDVTKIRKMTLIK